MKFGARIIRVFAASLRIPCATLLLLLSAAPVWAQPPAAAYALQVQLEQDSGHYLIPMTVIRAGEQVTLSTVPKSKLQAYVRVMEMAQAEQALLEIEIYEQRKGRPWQLSGQTLVVNLGRPGVWNADSPTGKLTIRASLSRTTAAPTASGAGKTVAPAAAPPKTVHTIPDEVRRAPTPIN